MLRRFECGHRYIAVFPFVWWSRDSPVVLQSCIAIEVTLLRFCFHLRYLCKLYISSTMSIKNSNNHNTCVHLLNSYNRLTVTTARLFKFLSRFSSQGHVRTAFSIPIWNICFMKPNTEMLCEEVKRSKDPWNERNIMTETQNIATEMLAASQELLSTLEDEENGYWETVIIMINLHERTTEWVRSRMTWMTLVHEWMSE